MTDFTVFQLRSTCLTTVVLLAGCAGMPPSDEPVGPTLSGVGITLYAAGDIADCRRQPAADTMAARTAEVIAAGLASEPAAVALTLGDNVYQTGSAIEHADCYQPTWGRFKERTLPSPGNHEYYSGATGYFDYFGTLAGPERRGYYSTDVGSWHLVSLNSNLKGAAQQAQLDWLKADLTAHHTPCTLAYWHHPVFSSGGHGNNAVMRDAWTLLSAAGADLVLSGHDHDYERFALQDVDGYADDAHGMRQFVVGTGGAELTPFVIRRANSQTSENGTYGVLKMALKPKGYAWEFVPVAGGTYRDHGSALCHG